MNGQGGDTLRSSVRHAAGRATVTLVGDLDRLTGPEVIDLVNGIGGAVEHIDIDLTQVHFLDLGGLRALLRAHHDSARRGIGLTARHPQRYALWLLQVTDAAQVLMKDPPASEPWPTDGRRHDVAAYERLLWEQAARADDRDRIANEREKLLDERQRRVDDHQQWEDIREDLANERELDLERRERER